MLELKLKTKCKTIFMMRELAKVPQDIAKTTKKKVDKLDFTKIKTPTHQKASGK
jgi:hypothetical protein